MKLDKDKIKKSMEDHLRSKGWHGPNTNGDHIVLNELQNMFNKLLSEGLVITQYWEMFYSAAIGQKQKADFMKIFGG